ncbi:MAG: helix-turn-helix domain-containing protein [Thermodesulfobacteriota bacterium]
MNRRALGAFLRARRKERGLTVRQLADLSKITHAHISRLENGLSTPSLETTDSILKALDADWPTFLRAAGFLEEDHPARYASEADEDYEPRR